MPCDRDRLRGSNIHSAPLSTSTISGSYSPLSHVLRISLSTVFKARASMDVTVCMINFGRGVCVAGGIFLSAVDVDGGAETCDTGTDSCSRIPVHVRANASKNLFSATGPRAPRLVELKERHRPLPINLGDDLETSTTRLAHRPCRTGYPGSNRAWASCSVRGKDECEMSDMSAMSADKSKLMFAVGSSSLCFVGVGAG